MKSLGLASIAEIRRKKERIENKADERLKQLESRLGKPLEKMSSVFLATLLRQTTRFLYKQRASMEMNLDDYLDHLNEIEELRSQRNKKRVENRSDQVDRRAFQEAVLANIEHYPTIAAARRDLQKKPQFQNRHYSTLERWARKVWPTKPKVGRPKNPG